MRIVSVPIPRVRVTLPRHSHAPWNYGRSRGRPPAMAEPCAMGNQGGKGLVLPQRQPRLQITGAIAQRQISCGKFTRSTV